jgi:hypothetical protein
MNAKVDAYKGRLAKAGFDRRAVLDDREMGRLVKLLGELPGALDTPPEELRYIEGLLDLPLGHIHSFRIVPKPGFEACGCGRTPSALDLVAFAYRRRVHERDLIRDTLLGLENLFELAEDGRVGECIRCGRRLESAVYWTNAYAYA